jgi:ribosomal protein S18 acetylase RimI-like enzyme
MDGNFVDPTARGRGVGTALLDAIVDEARARGYAEVRLDVIDNNPRARTLYERRGFVAGDTQYLGPLKYLFGFSAATTMVRPV